MIGERLKELREKRGILQRQLADMLKLTQQTISLYESDQREPDAETLKKIADFFNTTTDFLLGRTNTSTPADKIIDSVSDDPELAKFWDELKEREDLKLLFKQTREMSPEDVKKVIRIIKAIEDEEAANDDI